MTFGERLYTLRNEKNISQEEFAEIMDVSRQSISKWETDKAYPEMTRLIFMSDYFGVTAVLIGIAFAMCYGGGYVIGQAIYHLTH